MDGWNSDLEHVIDDIPDFTKPNIDDQWNQACQLEDAMVAAKKNLMSLHVAVIGVLIILCKQGLTDTIDRDILELSTYSETKSIKRPSRIRVSTSANDFVLHNSNIGKSVFDICNICHKSFSKKEPQLP